MIKKGTALLLAALMLLSAAALGEEEDGDLEIEEIIEEVVLDDEGGEHPLSEQNAPAAASGEFIPSYGSAYAPRSGERNYWTLPMDITDEQAVWEMLMQPITVVDIGKKSGEKSQTYLYREPDEESLKIGVVTCESQGVRVLETLDSGWSLVECYSSSFQAGDAESLHGHRLRQADPAPVYLPARKAADLPPVLHGRRHVERIEISAVQRDPVRGIPADEQGRNPGERPAVLRHGHPVQQRGHDARGAPCQERGRNEELRHDGIQAGNQVQPRLHPTGRRRASTWAGSGAS